MTQDAALPTYGAIYAFGDSLSDAGNLSIATTGLDGSPTPISPPYYQEQYGPLGLITANVFSNGPTWVQDLSLALSLGTLEPSLIGGTDFAYGGAETGPTPQNADDTEIEAISLPAQLALFQSDYPHPTANALDTSSIGSNDLLDILGDSDLSAQGQTTDVQAAVSNEIGFLDQLVSGGAKNLLVLDIPDLGKTPEVIDGLSGGSPSLASALASEYNTDLAAGLASIAGGGVDVTLINAFQLIDNAVASPSAYDLGNASTPVWSGSYSVAGSGSLVSTIPSVQDQYLFFDHLHPTETGQLAVAKLAEADLSGTAACFAAGTRIATERGDVLVQHLRIGDWVRLAEGGTAPVVWLGHRRVDCRRHPRPGDVQPVRIAAHAFGLGRPCRDVWLSPDHAVFVDDVLIPVRCLLNDATVRQEDFSHITYWHVELPAHGVLLAEGLPSESFLDTGNRGAFANGGPTVMAHPGFARAVWEADGCAPLVIEGPARDLVQRRLLVQALALGWELGDEGAPARLTPGVSSHARASVR